MLVPDKCNVHNLILQASMQEMVGPRVWLLGAFLLYWGSVALAYLWTQRAHPRLLRYISLSGRFMIWNAILELRLEFRLFRSLQRSSMRLQE